MKAAIKRALRRAGWDLHRYQPTASPDAQLARVLQVFGIDLVLDIGANHGQYGALLRELGYRGRTVSYEPLGDAHAALTARAAADPDWTVAQRTAIGAEDGHITINIAGNSASSSVLPMLAAHGDAAPESRYVGSEDVPLARLDGLAAPYLASARAPFVKIDTQGFEAAVLAGAADTLAAASAVQIELSLIPLYEGQALYAAITADLQARGFELWAIWPGFGRAHDGRLLQMDGIFARPERARG